MQVSHTNVKPHIGSRVEVNPEQLADRSVVEEIRTLLEERGVLVFPRLALTDEQQVAFTDLLGTRLNIAGDGEAVYKITLDPEKSMQVEYVQATFFWHMDGLTAGGIPPKATLLSGHSVASRGGQTEFANTYIAYETLPQDLKEEIEDLKVVHSMKASMYDIHGITKVVDDNAPWNKVPDQEHPLVWTHQSGRKSLVLAATADHIIGMPRADGRALLARLLQWTVQPDFSYSHNWEQGDLVVWDNCGTLHRAIPYDNKSGRMMHRTTIEGIEPLR